MTWPIGDRFCCPSAKTHTSTAFRVLQVSKGRIGEAFRPRRRKIFIPGKESHHAGRRKLSHRVWKLSHRVREVITPGKGSYHTR